MIVSVGTDPFATAFNRQGSEKGVWDKVAFNICRGTEAREDIPVTWSRIDDRTVGLIAELYGKGHGFRHRAWGVKDLWVGHHAKKPAQD